MATLIGFVFGYVLGICEGDKGAARGEGRRGRRSARPTRPASMVAPGNGAWCARPARAGAVGAVRQDPVEAQGARLPAAVCARPAERSGPGR